MPVFNVGNYHIDSKAVIVFRVYRNDEMIGTSSMVVYIGKDETKCLDIVDREFQITGKLMIGVKFLSNRVRQFSSLGKRDEKIR